MSRYRTITEGASVVDIANAEGGYNYYGYVRSLDEKTWVIMREIVAGTEYRFAVGSENDVPYATAWAGRAGLSYAPASSYKY